MGQKVLLNYDELRTIVKKFRDEGEDVVQMHASMRARVQDLHKDWIGEGANKFFNEMENDLLPALTRLAGALFYAQDVLHKIVKTIQTFDEDTAGYFKADLDQANPIQPGALFGGAAAGAGLGGTLGAAMPGGTAGAGDASGVAAAGNLSGAGAGDSIDATGTPVPASQAGLGQAGGGSFSQGLQGNLQGSGAAGGVQAGGIGVGAPMDSGMKTADHIYADLSGAGAGDSSAPPSQAAGSADSGVQASGGAGDAAAARRLRPQARPLSLQPIPSKAG